MKLNEELLMSHPQTQMLYKCIQHLTDGGKWTHRQAFWKLVDYFAQILNLNDEGKVFKCRNYTLEALELTMDLELLKADTWDWIGELYVGLGLVEEPTSSLYTSRETTFEIAKTLTDLKPAMAGMPVTIVDPRVGSARVLLAAYSLMGNKGMYFGIERDPGFYHMALINMELYGVPAFILRANTFNTDVSFPSDIWRMCNYWKTVINRKKPKEAVVQVLT